MALAHKLKLTYEDYCLVPEDKRVELIDGEFLLSPAPNTGHQDDSGNVYAKLRQWIMEHDLGKIYFAPTDVILSNHDVVQPDLLFIAKDRLDIIKRHAVVGPPDLVVEILSPRHEIGIS